MDNVQQNQDIVAFSEVKRAVLVAAHPDDIETMMGGTAYLLAQAGVELFELIITRGDLGTSDASQTRDGLAGARKGEAERGAKVLGIREVAILDYSDGELEPTLELRAAIASYYRRWQADTLFTFDPAWFGQIHPDHRAASRAAVDAIMPSKMPLYHPEQLGEAGPAKITRAFLFGPATADIRVDVTEVYPTKIAASLAHTSQFPGGESDLDWMRELDRKAAEAAGYPERLYEQFSSLRVW